MYKLKLLQQQWELAGCQVFYASFSSRGEGCQQAAAALIQWQHLLIEHMKATFLFNRPWPIELFYINSIQFASQFILMQMSGGILKLSNGSTQQTLYVRSILVKSGLKQITYKHPDMNIYQIISQSQRKQHLEFRLLKDICDV